MQGKYPLPLPSAPLSARKPASRASRSHRLPASPRSVALPTPDLRGQYPFDPALRNIRATPCRLLSDIPERPTESPTETCAGMLIAPKPDRYPSRIFRPALVHASFSPVRPTRRRFVPSAACSRSVAYRFAPCPSASPALSARPYSSHRRRRIFRRTFVSRSRASGYSFPVFAAFVVHTPPAGSTRRAPVRAPLTQRLRRPRTRSPYRLFAPCFPLPAPRKHASPRRTFRPPASSCIPLTFAPMPASFRRPPFLSFIIALSSLFVYSLLRSRFFFAPSQPLLTLRSQPACTYFLITYSSTPNSPLLPSVSPDTCVLATELRSCRAAL